MGGGNREQGDVQGVMIGVQPGVRGGANVPQRSNRPERSSALDRVNGTSCLIE